MSIPGEKKRLPDWFKVALTTTEKSAGVRDVIRRNNLHTVCTSAACPNRTECWNAGTATFMILGDVCTRTCGFCNVSKGSPSAPDCDEPRRVAEGVFALGLRYAVITSVTRDDLSDGGASLFADTIDAIRALSPHCRTEVLIPDFRGSETALQSVLTARPHVLNHNLETVPSLYPRVRPQADFDRSLEVLSRATAFGATTKTGLMLGLGEGNDEILETLSRARQTGCSILTLGQYLQPGRGHLPVERYYHPEEFEALRTVALEMGFCYVMAGPLIRSSYHAERSGS